MDKTELLNAAKQLDGFDSSEPKDYEYGFNQCKSQMLQLIEELDEPIMNSVESPGIWVSMRNQIFQDMGEFLRGCPGSKSVVDIFAETKALLNTYEDRKKHEIPRKLEKWLIREDYSNKTQTERANMLIGMIYGAIDDSFVTDVRGWLAEEKTNLFILADVLRYGYTINEKPLYVMPVPYLNNFIYGVSENGKVDAVTKNYSNSDIKTEYTKEEIEKHFPDIKDQAIKVEGV